MSLNARRAQMNFEQNLFISYAHIDDAPLNAGQKGWISRFHTSLDAMLSMRLGRDAKIWRDEKLQGNDVFSDEIVARFRRCALLMSVVTPRYVDSEWCTREAREFCQSAEETGGLTVGNKSRVFKVIKTPPDTQETLPAHMKDLLGFEFYTDKDGALLELDPDFGPEYSQLYLRKVGRLAQDIAQLLKALQADDRASAGGDGKALNDSQPPGKPAVYLAECGYDRKPQRELLEGELKRLDYPVLPDKRLPVDELEYVQAVQSLMARCALSIHLVGERYGAVPDGPTDRSASVIQNEEAVARCRAGGLNRLIWLPQGTGSEDDRQRKFIAALQEDAEAQFGADLIAGDIEELRTAVHATLKKIEQPEPKQPAGPPGDQHAPQDGTKLVYFIICDEKDRKASIPVRKLCKQLGFECVLSGLGGDAAEVRKANHQNSANCDAVILFYGTGDEAWKRANRNELKKMAAYRGERLPPAATYLAEPRTDDKQDMIDMEEEGLIDGRDGLTESALTKFLEQVAKAPTAA
jgi:hypothetical protein